MPRRSRPASGRPRPPTSSSTWNPRSCIRRRSRPISAGRAGGLYEFRTYTYGPGAIPKVIEAWSPRIKERAAVSPLIFAGYTDIGALNQWVHVWAYKNMGDRETQAGAGDEAGQWPPPRGEGVVLHRQQSTFAIPAKWSPAR